VAAAGFALLGDLTLIAAVTDFAVYFVFLAINLTVILLRWKKPEWPRPFAVPGSVGRIPIVPILALLSVLAMICRLEGGAVWMGLGLSLVGLLLAVLPRRSRR
jgi:APA family basic amino acid/polyamine antiporter